MKEIRVWSTLAHTNILPLLGFVIEGDYPSLVSEWMENGTASQYVKEYPAYDLSGLVSLISIPLGYGYHTWLLGPRHC